LFFEISLGFFFLFVKKRNKKTHGMAADPEFETLKQKAFYAPLTLPGIVPLAVMALESANKKRALNQDPLAKKQWAYQSVLRIVREHPLNQLTVATGSEQKISVSVSAIVTFIEVTLPSILDGLVAAAQGMYTFVETLGTDCSACSSCWKSLFGNCSSSCSGSSSGTAAPSSGTVVSPAVSDTPVIH